MIDAVLSPLLQSYTVPPLAVIVVVVPEHTLFAPDMTAVNDGEVVMVFSAVPVHPLTSLTVTV